MEADPVLGWRQVPGVLAEVAGGHSPFRAVQNAVAEDLVLDMSRVPVPGP